MARHIETNRARAFALWFGGGLLACVWLVVCQAAVGADESEAEVFFESKIRPILVERCQGCHGAEKVKGGLDLTGREGLTKGGESGPAVVAGKPEESLLMEAVGYEFEPRMPPDKKLADSEIAALSKWIAEGAAWPSNALLATRPGAVSDSDAFTISPEQRDHWAFQPLARTELPAVHRSDWPRTGVDRYILARLEDEGLEPADEADRRTLIRRLSFGVTGLPPEPEAVAEFVADPAEDAYERLVDRLLDSPGYGQRWARHWLDVVRYADSLDSRGSGQPGDILDAWRYRDWVVDALNADMPYDRFVQLQIAGDRLPPVSPEEGSDGYNRAGTIATTMLAIGNWGNGDADKDKILTDIADDQVDVVSKAFMGLTVACARCHDHKFDPISQRDYYALAGIFFSTHILPKLTPKGAGETIARVPLASPGELERRAEHERGLAETRAKLQAETQARYEALSVSLRGEIATYLMALADFERSGHADPSVGLAAFASERGLHPHALRRWRDRLGLGGYRLMDQPISNVLGAADVRAWKGAADTPSASVNAGAQAVSLLTFQLPARSVSVHPGPASGVAVVWTSPISGVLRVSGSLADGDPAGGDGVAWALEVQSRGGRRTIAKGALANGGNQALAQGEGASGLRSVRVEPGDRLELVVLPGGSHTCDTTSVDLVLSDWSTGEAWDLARDVVDSFLEGNPHADRFGHAGVWSFEDLAGAARTDQAAETAGSPLARWRDAFSQGADRDTLSELARAVAPEEAGEGLSSPFWIDRPEAEAALPADAVASLNSLRRELADLEAAMPAPLEYANAAQEGGVPESPHAGVHDVAVHIRGRHDRLGPVVPRGFPGILTSESAPSIQAGSGRVELAAWLTSPEHPLTPRVIVNRLWQHHFGAGIVATPGNFGMLGEPPTHPELLDYLARRLIDEGWSLRAVHREILLSATYRQSSVPNSVALERDPANRLYARMSRRRLEAEPLRDALLQAAGRLDTSLGGPADRDPMTRRRALYAITVRSDRATYAALFDQADSTAPAAERTVTTVAPQALYFLNNPFVIEQARALAERLVAASADDDARIALAYERLYGRAVTDAEREIARGLLAGERQQGADDTRAWTALAQVLICANEFFHVD